MKKLILSLTLFASLALTQLNAQDYVKLLKTGQYQELAQYFSSQVKIEVDRNKKVLSRDKAVDMLQSKLESSGIVKWETMHKGSSEEENANYLIVKAHSSDQKGLRIFFQLDGGNGNKQISAIRVRPLL